MPSRRTFVTGFGPFGATADNPSAWLAERSGRPHRVLEVSFAAVERFLDDLNPDSFDRLVMLGLAGGERDPRLRLETRARNQIGGAPDVTGVVAGPGPIAPFMPPQLGASLFTGNLATETDRWRISVDAGDYLCNFALFRALRTFPKRRVGFVHVPPPDVWPLEEQRLALAEFLEEVESGRPLADAPYEVPTEGAMRRLGASFAGAWRPGELVALEGPLGAGKTTLVRGLLEGLGWAEPVRSPTFNLVQTFATEPPVCHADLYRVGSEEGLDLERYLDRHLCLVEWPDRLRWLVPDRVVRIETLVDVRRVRVGPGLER